MTLHLARLPYELLSCIIAGLDLEDVANLARCCKQFQFLEREDSLCRILLETKVPRSHEATLARKGHVSWASAYRRVTKRREAVACAAPFSVSIVAFGDSHLYNGGVLSYIVDDTLRILNLHASNKSEVVVSISGLLQHITTEPDQSGKGRFRLLYHNEDIAACLYRSCNPVSAGWLIVINTAERSILLTRELQTVKKIFVRHDRNFLYYGTLSEQGYDGYKCWVLEGYRFEDQQKGLGATWFDEKIYLRDLIGSEIDHTICFAMHDSYFYAVSNQTTREVEEVDWTSCYHAVRFPVDSPSMLLLEPSQDFLMWRRQHAEGPIDDRWTKLRLDVDEATGFLKIIETRTEWLRGGSKSTRTFYIKQINFRQKPMDEILCTVAVTSSKSSSLVSSLLTSIGTPSSTSSSLSSESTANLATTMLAALTSDRLALTLTPDDNPHYLPPQTRLPRDLHTADDSPFVFSKVHLSYYNTSANSYVDLVDDPRPSSPQSQRLRLRVGSRRLKSPSRIELDDLSPESASSLTDEMNEGLNDRYTNNAVSFWPPEQDDDYLQTEEFEDLTRLMNPTTHARDVQATADERSLVYASGEKGQPQAIMFISFDPAIKLHGLSKWRDGLKTKAAVALSGARMSERPVHPECAIEEKESSTGAELDLGNQMADVEGVTGLGDPDKDAATGGHSMPTWIRTEQPMYRAINRGYDLSL
ncbi:MAG: hypothetical protein M1818_004073 [Claussenomyces sp. TS43310]|nr:MAG: hypothetical protein M1818_004073 [Claussenomyces sp. TS43310]